MMRISKWTIKFLEEKKTFQINFSFLKNFQNFVNDIIWNGNTITRHHRFRPTFFISITSQIISNIPINNTNCSATNRTYFISGIFEINTWKFYVKFHN